MKVEVFKKFSEEETLDMIRRVPLLEKVDGEDFVPYRDSQIAFDHLRPRSVNPTTFYLLRRQLEFQRELRKVLIDEYEIDTLNLEGAVNISIDGGDPRVLFPPVVEVTSVPIESFGALALGNFAGQPELEYERVFDRIKVPIVNDGMHRIWIADEDGISLTRVVYVTDPSERFPFYAYPNGWNKIKIVDEVPKDPKDKKLYRLRNPKLLYRNFGVFNGSTMREGGQRSG